MSGISEFGDFSTLPYSPLVSFCCALPLEISIVFLVFVQQEAGHFLLVRMHEVEKQGNRERERVCMEGQGGAGG
jgi:hypothetical protein